MGETRSTNQVRLSQAVDRRDRGGRGIPPRPPQVALRYDLGGWQLGLPPFIATSFVP